MTYQYVTCLVLVSLLTKSTEKTGIGEKSMNLRTKVSISSKKIDPIHLTKVITYHHIFWQLVWIIKARIIKATNFSFIQRVNSCQNPLSNFISKESLLLE